MVKVSNKKRILSDNVNKKKNDNRKKKPINPFEIHINKQKYQILGQKLKNDRGLPGVSRANAIKKRKRTLLQEYNVYNKSNKFVDKRIGEKNFSMTIEDKQMARFTAERLKSHSKKTMFNLADEEVLTHRGQTLSEIEKYDDPRSDDDDDDDMDLKKSSGKLDDNFVKDAHFGGGILKKSGPDGAKSHKELIDQLIAESKKRKAEKQKIREQTLELTEKLDNEWKDLLPLVNKSNKNDQAADISKNTDSYDKMMRELRFEARGQPSDRLKSEDEVAKEEREKLEKMEKERLDRMYGIVEKKDQKVNHRSADDLNDNFAYDSEPETTLAYNLDGKCIVDPENIDQDKTKNGVENDVSDGEEEGSESGEEEEETDDDLSDLKEDESESSEDETIVETNKKNKQNECNEIPNKKRKIEDSSGTVGQKSSKQKKVEKIPNESAKNIMKKENLDMSETIKQKKENIEKSKKCEKLQKENIVNIKSVKTKKITVNENTSDAIEPIQEIIIEVDEKIREEAANQLPFTYILPKTYEDLQALISDKSPDQQSIVIERMIKCNHPNLADGNKQSLGVLFAYLLQHLNDVSSDPVLSFAILDKLTPHLFDLAQLNPENAHMSLIEVMKEKQCDYRKKLKAYPGIDVLLFIKLISCLFPTSDFRHQVVTPTIIFIGQMLTKCRVRTRYDISYGLFLVTMILEYTILSKRFIPAAINYLIGLIHMAIPKIGLQLLKVTPPFKPAYTTLVLAHKSIDNNLNLMLNKDDFIIDEIDENFKIRTLHNVVKLIEEFYENNTNLSSCIDIFSPVLHYLEKIPGDNYPMVVLNNLKKVKNVIENGIENRSTKFIVLAAKRPKALRLYEPNIVKIVEGKNHKIMTKDKADKAKLLHKYKREMKGALREIRRDKSFLGRVKIQQRIQSDQERRDKVKQIYSEASIQQSEFNAMDRKKKTK